MVLRKTKKMDPTELGSKIQSSLSSTPDPDIRRDLGLQVKQAPKLATSQAKLIPIELVDPHPLNKRIQENLSTAGCAEDMHSLVQSGQTTPIDVIPDPDSSGRFLAIAGSRRLFMIRSLAEQRPQDGRFQNILAIVHPKGSLDDQAILMRSWAENEHRKDLNPYEKALFVREIHEQTGSTHNETAAKLHKSRPWVSQMLKLASYDLPAMGLTGKELDALTQPLAIAWLRAPEDKIQAAIKRAKKMGLSGKKLVAWVTNQLRGQPEPREKPVTHSEKYGPLSATFTRKKTGVNIDISITADTIPDSFLDTFFEKVREELLKKQ